jgi:cobalt-zinc-cadmium efflux system outer membrane protein
MHGQTENRVRVRVLLWLAGSLVVVAPPGPSTTARARGEVPPEVGRQFVPPPPVPPQPHDLAHLERSGQEVPKGAVALTLKDLEALAAENNPTLLQARAQVDGTLGKAIQAGLWPNPVIGYVAEQIAAEGTPGEFQGGFVRQEIVTARKRRLSREKYLARTQVSEWVALAQQYRVINDVRLHYFRALGRQALVQVRQELLKNAEDNLRTVREMYNVGQANRAEAHQANVALQQARLERLMAENDYRQTLETLAALVGVDQLPGPPAGTLEGEAEPIDWQAAAERLLAESPELQAAHAKFRADRITVQRERAQPIPNVFVQGGVGYNFEVDQTVAAAQVYLQVPLWNRNQGTIRQAQADLARQQGEIRRTELRLRRDLAQEYRHYLTALQHVTNYREVILPESRKAYVTLLNSYKANRVAWPVVLDAERRYYRLRGEYVRNLMAWRESEVLIRGLLLHGGLEAPTRPTPPGHIDAVPQPR